MCVFRSVSSRLALHLFLVASQLVCVTSSPRAVSGLENKCLLSYDAETGSKWLKDKLQNYEEFDSQSIALSEL